MVIDSSKVIHGFHSHAAQLERLGSRTEGLLAALPVGITKTLIVHLEGGSYLETWIGLHSPSGTQGIISARIWFVVHSVDRGMLNSLVSHTERSVFPERKALSGSQLRSVHSG